jgi:hypothetical protein
MTTFPSSSSPPRRVRLRHIRIFERRRSTTSGSSASLCGAGSADDQDDPQPRSVAPSTSDAALLGPPARMCTGGDGPAGPRRGADMAAANPAREDDEAAIRSHEPRNSHEPQPGTDPQQRGLVARAVTMTTLASLALATPAAYLLEAYRNELRLYPHQGAAAHHGLAAGRRSTGRRHGRLCGRPATLSRLGRSGHRRVPRQPYPASRGLYWFVPTLR